MYSFYSPGPGYSIEISEFKVSTAEVTTGGLIGAPSGLDPFLRGRALLGTACEHQFGRRDLW